MRMINDLFCFTPRSESVGLCLSGGGALGFAHIGVIQALEEHGISPRHVIGTSMGAIVGTLYAAGYKPKELLQIIKDNKLYKLSKIMSYRPSLMKSGLYDHEVILSVIKRLIPHNKFSKLEKNMQVCVVNLTKSRWEIKGGDDDLDKWLPASASIPGFFQALEHDGNYYVDGALLNNLPAQGIENQCRHIIGVDVIPPATNFTLNKPIDTFAFALRVMEHHNSIEGRDLCRFIIEPNAYDTFHEFSFDAYEDIYKIGYDTAIKYINENKEILYLK